MSRAFRLVDLVSQCTAVQHRLKGCSINQKLAWLALKGKLTLLPALEGSGRQDWYAFESDVGLRAAFSFSGERFVFMGDNTTFTVKDGDSEA